MASRMLQARGALPLLDALALPVMRGNGGSARRAAVSMATAGPTSRALTTAAWQRGATVRRAACGAVRPMQLSRAFSSKEGDKRDEQHEDNDPAAPPAADSDQKSDAAPAIPLPPVPIPPPQPADAVPANSAPTIPMPERPAGELSKPPTPEEKEADEEAEKKAAAEAEAEANATVFAPIPTTHPEAELEVLRKEAAARAHAAEEAAAAVAAASGHTDHDPSASLPKVSSSGSIIRGTLWFDNMYPMRVHWLDLRYLFATHNHDVIIPRLFKTARFSNGFTLLSATPRANEGGVFVHFEVARTSKVRTPEDVTSELIKLLRAKPVHAMLTPKAVRCHLVRGKPFLDDMASRFPYNRLRVEIRGPNSALADVTVEQLYNEFSQFGKIVDLTLGPFEKDKSRIANVQYVRVFSAVGARNCMHRLRLTVPLVVGSLPASVAPSDDSAAAVAKVQPTPTADAIMFLTYESLLKTSYVTDFFVKHPRIMVPLLGLAFAFLTYLIFDPLRVWNITNHVTHRLEIGALYARLPWPFGWIRQRASELGQSSVVRMLRRGAGMEEDSTTTSTSWSAREADEENVRKWLNSAPDRILFLTGPKGAGKQALAKKLAAGRDNVVTLDVSHMLDRPDDEFIKALSAAVGFTPGLSNIMDIFTPGASKASGSSTASSAQILKVLECTSTALVNIAAKENAKRQKEQREREQRKMEKRKRQQEEAKAKGGDTAAAAVAAAGAGADHSDHNDIKPVDVDKALNAAGQASGAAGSTTTASNQQAAGAAAGNGGAPSPAAQAAGAVLKMTGGMDPSGASPTAAAAAQAAATPPASPQGAAAPAPASKPANNNFEPMSRGPADSVPATAHISSESAPLRLQEESLHALDAAETTDQQRNYAEFKRTRTESASKGGHPYDPSSAVPAGTVSSGGTASLKKSPTPDSLPLFIIDGFNADNASKHSNFLNVLVAWSAEMSAAGAARFIYLTDAGLEEQVSKALPDVHMAEVVLSDASPEAAQEFLFASLPPKMRARVPRGDPQTLSALRILGGRYNDLMTLVRGLENGSHPVETVEEIVLQAMSTTKSMLFTEDKNIKWSKVQMWQCINLLVQAPSGCMLYDDLLFNVFSGDDTPLKALVRSDLLRVEPALGRGGDRVRAGSPVFLEAFKRLVNHQHKLKPGMDLLVIKYQIGVEQAKISAAEEELIKIAAAAAEETAHAAASADAQRYAHTGAQWDHSFGHLSESYARRRANASSARAAYHSSAATPAGGSMSDLRDRQSFLLRLLSDSQSKVAALDVKRRECEKKIKDIKKTDE